jgi:hypothetical protein
VRFADHQQEVERLRGLLREWRKLPAHTSIDDLERRTDKELA